MGPTASGKTELSLEIARRVPAEVVSLDSRQVYRGMDVGTDKVGVEARAAVPHHGLDLVDPDERYSAGRFARDARGWIDAIRRSGRLPLLVGGTGFFLKALMEPIFSEPPLDRERRSALRSWLAEQPAELLAGWVWRLDPERAEVAVEGGPHRVGRTLEVALLTGRPLSWWHREAAADGEPVAGVVVVLDLPRAVMDARIDARVGAMVERGLVDEVRALVDRGFGPHDPGMTGTGYAEILEHLSGRVTLEEAVEEIRRNTRRYARRQLTWLRHQLPDEALRIDATLPVAEQASASLRAWERASGAGAAP